MKITIREHIRRDGSKFYTAHRRAFGFIPAHFSTGFSGCPWHCTDSSGFTPPDRFESAEAAENAVRAKHAEMNARDASFRAAEVVSVSTVHTFTL